MKSYRQGVRFDKDSSGADTDRNVENLPLSLVVITKNEEANLERCLRSVPFADDIVVVDSQSTDRTVEIAEKCGARVFQQTWLGFGPQKKVATARAKNDWILSLDADEALSPELAKELHHRWSALDPEAGYLCPRRSFHLGRWILHGGWTPDYQLRLFNRRSANWNEAVIHEKVIASKVEKLESPILHWVFQNLSDQILTNDRYSSLQAQERFAKGERSSVLKILIRPWIKFFETYFLKAGFLDGMPGFLISVSAAYSVFCRYGKLWELGRKEPTP